jgi:SAM-dependent methyltransferase
MIKDFSAKSGERVSATTDDRIITDHLARYQFAANFVNQHFNDARCTFGADVFCGSGYGTNILARDTGATILGIDGSSEAVAEANICFPRANIIFSTKLFPFKLPNSTFDFLCSFESLEHILDYTDFASQITQSIKKDGYLLVSCPNSDRIDLDINPYHWHYKHLNPSELINLFESFEMEIIHQYSTLCVIPDTSRKVIAVNHFAIPINEICNDFSGDTLFFIFKKR